MFESFGYLRRSKAQLVVFSLMMFLAKND